MNEAAKRQLLRQAFTYGAYVLTIRAGRERHARLVTWVSQVSFTPALVMVALRAGSRAHTLIQRGTPFGLSVLGRGQGTLARRFAAPSRRGGERWAGVAWEESPRGVVHLAEAVGSLDCRPVTLLPTGGDHDLLVGEVLEARVQRAGEPLTLRETKMAYGG